MKLVQIPLSHNCVKVRVALERKGIAYEVENVPPPDRRSVLRQSGQGLVPVLIDGDRAIADSTAILLYLEERYPDPPLVPRDPTRRAECLVLEDWADRALMEVSRRIAYFQVMSTPGKLGSLFFPTSRGLRLFIQDKVARRLVSRRFRISAARYPRDAAAARAAAALAVSRLGARPYLLGETLTIADIALAAMAAPLAVDREVAKDNDVAALLAWGAPIIGEKNAAYYKV